MKQSQDRSSLKLSELATHLNIPEGVTTTDWFDVEERCGEFGISFDRWQQGIGTITLAHRKDGQYACGIGGAWLSIPRQTGKTYLYGWMVFALATLKPNLTVVWTTHHLSTTDQTFNKMASMAEKSSVKPYIAGVRRANGQQRIKFKNGSEIMFGSRAYGFGRGFDEVDIMVFDECQILTEAALSDMLPATNAAPNGLPIFMGTPPRPKDPGEAFTTRRMEAIDGGDPDTLYVEFSANENAKIIDWKELARANPSFPHRTSKTAVQRMQKNIGSIDNFKREAYGIWDKVASQSSPFNLGVWDRLAVDTPPTEGTDSYAIRFTPDGSTVALAAARKPVEPGAPVHVEAVYQAPAGEGLEWIADWVSERKNKAAQIVVEGKASRDYLVAMLRDRGVRNKRQILTPSFGEVIAAHGMFHHAVQAKEVSHSSQELLNSQIQQAQYRKLGTQGGFGWQAPDGETVATLEAVTFAYWAAKTTKRKPGRKQVISV